VGRVFRRFFIGGFMTKLKQKKLPFSSDYQFRDLHHAMEVWTNHIKKDGKLFQRVERWKMLEDKGVHILYEEQEEVEMDRNIEADLALIYLLEKSHTDPMVARIFDRNTPLFPAELGSITDFEVFCWLRHRNIIYKDQVRTQEELMGMFKSLPLHLRRELQEYAKELDALFPYPG